MSKKKVVVPFPTQNASEKKWGKAVVKAGFTIVPSILLKAQRRLGLSPAHLAILMHLCDMWWVADRPPFPSKGTLSQRLGIGERQIQRYLAELEGAGLVRREQRYASHGGKLSNIYHLDGLVDRLRQLAPEFLKVENEVKAKREEVSTPLRLRQNRASRKN